MRAVGRGCRQLVALALWGLVILLVAAYVGSGRTSGQELHHAGLVVTFEDGRTERRCVEFTEEEISGAELLRRLGLPVVLSNYAGLGAGVCRIDDTGCGDPGDCFCQCRGASCAYWSYFALRDGEWRFQNVGASQRGLHDGDVDGWVWGSGRTPPEEVTFRELCPLAVPTLPPPAPPPTASAGPQGGSPDASSNARTAAPADPSSPVALPERSELTEASGNPTSAGPTDSVAPAAGGTPPAPPDVLQAAARGEGSGDDGRAGDAQTEPVTADETGGGPPTGLIAFGAVAGLLVAVIGGLALRRRLSG